MHVCFLWPTTEKLVYIHYLAQYSAKKRKKKGEQIQDPDDSPDIRPLAVL